MGFHSPDALLAHSRVIHEPQRDLRDSGSTHLAALMSQLRLIFSTALWFGVVAGLGEGLGLLAFQRINWAAWARTIHVSRDILWISPLADLGFYALLALLVGLLRTCIPRWPALRTLIFLLIFFTAYDWLMVTGRLYRRAALVLALGIAMALSRWLKGREAQVVRVWKTGPWLIVGLAALIMAIVGGQRFFEDRAVAHLPRARPGSPNVLVVVLDTLRADHLSSYGYERSTSPEIDRLAREGVLFQNAIAPSSWSLPSHASLLTGRTVAEHGFGNVQPMPWLGWGRSGLKSLPTLGEALEAQGYRTGAFSANRIYFTSNVGLGRGFIHFEDYFYSVGDSFLRTQFGREFARLYMNRSPKSTFTHAFRRLGLSSWLDKDSEGSGDYGGAFGIRKRANEVNREALRWITADREHPFFACLNYLDVHFAYGGPANYTRPTWDHGTTDDEYDAGLKYDDDFLGFLLDGLEELGLRRNTVIIITSDHGESLGDHGLSFHGASLYWELVHVPLIISYPGKIPQGVRVDQPVSIAAIPGTVLNLINAPQNPFPGPPLALLWDQSGRGDWPLAVSELPQTNTIVAADRRMQGRIPLATDGWMKSVVSPRWHLITHEELGDQIYDWRADPRETTDLSHTPEGRRAAAALKAAEGL
jgi:arylsulfatase A-like enzyme